MDMEIMLSEEKGMARTEAVGCMEEAHTIQTQHPILVPVDPFLQVM